MIVTGYSVLTHMGLACAVTLTAFKDGIFYTLVLVKFFCSFSYCEYDLVLEDKSLYVSQHPPEHHQDGKVLYPCKLDQLPEAGVVVDSHLRVL